jgi:hypothetical protein
MKIALNFMSNIGDNLGERAIALHGMYESPLVTNQTKILDKLE